MGMKGKIFKFMSDILKDGSYYKLYTQAKSTSACGLPKGFFLAFLPPLPFNAFFSQQHVRDGQFNMLSKNNSDGDRKHPLFPPIQKALHKF